MTIANASQLEQFKRGTDYDVITLLKEPGLSVRLEQMQAGEGEVQHCHKSASQFFYVFEGTATVAVDGKIISLAKSQGLSISANTAHSIQNRENSWLKFLVVTQPEMEDGKSVI